MRRRRSASGREERVTDARLEGGAARDDMALGDEVMIVEPLEYCEMITSLPVHAL